MARNSWNPFPPSVPLKAKGGIKAQSIRGAFGKNWWARRWVETIESFDIGERLARGKAYAREGQVLSIQVEKGAVRAEVQGSRAKPYVVQIKVKTLEAEKWKALANALSSQAIFAAMLLAGEMPGSIEDVFKEAGLTLFPETSGDLETECSCPDWSNPCKHIAAVYYLLGEEFDRDPFLIFRLRGLDREDLIGLLGGAQAEKAKKDPLAHLEKSGPRPEPLPADPDVFWGRNLWVEEAEKEVGIPDVCAALPRRLGSFPFWRGKKSFLPAMEVFYENASPLGLDVFLGTPQLSGESGDLLEDDPPEEE
jgi:uncharacterized Zn finger protein